MIAALAFVVAFAAMEAVSYGTHRWLMHGPGMGWHASHHAPARGRFEANDRFPLCFAAVGFSVFALSATGVAPGWTWWAAAGITAYGVAYLVVHELFIHRRAPVPVPDVPYLRWLRDSHRAHHVDGGEPFGMLLPIMSRADRERVAASRPSGRRVGPSTGRATGRSSTDDLLARRAARGV